MYQLRMKIDSHPREYRDTKMVVKYQHPTDGTTALLGVYCHHTLDSKGCVATMTLLTTEGHITGTVATTGELDYILPIQVVQKLGYDYPIVSKYLELPLSLKTVLNYSLLRGY